MKTLRLISILSGALGALSLLMLSRTVSWLTFGSYEQAGAIALLAACVFADCVFAGQAAIVQGTRRIFDFAKMNVLGALYGTALGVPIIYLFHEKGLVPALICVSVLGAITSWWYAGKTKVQKTTLNMKQFVAEARSLLSLGVAFMSTILMMWGSEYLIRVILLRTLNLEAVGCFQAAWTLGGIYVGFILEAMGADFFPRLSAVAHDNANCNRLVNEQLAVGLLIAAPGTIAALTFAPLFIRLFYSASFGPAVEVFHWICLGMTLRVVSWPMGYILAAKGERNLFIATEVLKNLLFVLLVWRGVAAFGLMGVGMAFFGMYLAYWPGMYVVVRRLSGFRLSAMNWNLMLLFAPVIVGTFAAQYLLQPAAAIVLGTLVTAFASFYALKVICTLVPISRFPKPAQRILNFLRLAPLDREV